MPRFNSVCRFRATCNVVQLLRILTNTTVCIIAICCNKKKNIKKPRCRGCLIKLVLQLGDFFMSSACFIYLSKYFHAVSTVLRLGYFLHSKVFLKYCLSVRDSTDINSRMILRKIFWLKSKANLFKKAAGHACQTDKEIIPENSGIPWIIYQ